MRLRLAWAGLVPLLGLSGYVGCTADTFVGTDGGQDGQTTDSVAGGDAPLDAPSVDAPGGDVVSVDGGPDLSCANLLPGTVLCDDFDTPDAGGPAQKWTGQLTIHGQNTFDTTNFKSAPRSYQAATLLSDAGAFANAALLVQSFTIASGATLTARAHVRIHAIDPNSTVPLLKISYVPNSGTSVWAAIVVDNDRLKLVVQGDGSSVTSTDDLAGVLSDVWVFVQLDMAPAKVSVALDGIPIKTVNVTLNSPGNSPLPEADLGVLGGTTDFASVVNFDNFLFRIH